MERFLMERSNVAGIVSPLSKGGSLAPLSFPSPEVKIETKRLDHLGIVAGVCKEIGLVERIDELIPSERKVSIGEATLAMILNGLGFSNRRLYLTPQFFESKPVDLLIREGLEAEDFNDDSLGRALDKLYAYGLTKLFWHVASEALSVFGIDPSFKHLDTSTFSVEGEYQGDGTEQPIKITRGYSKDHRADLKQVVVSLMCSTQESLPTWIEVLSGNSSDKASFPKTISSYLQQMQDSEEGYFIADSALYSAKNLKELSRVYWISRVPESLKEVKALYLRYGKEELEPAWEEGYYYKELSSHYGGIAQRWLLIYSEQSYAKEAKTVRKRVEKEKKKAERKLWHLGNQEYAHREDALKEAKKLEKGWKYHRLEEVRIEEVRKRGKRGRRKKGEAPKEISYKGRGVLLDDKEKIEKVLQSKGKFILGTNQLDKEKLSNERLFFAYKKEQSSVERGFRFLKDPLFFASSFFLEKVERIMALTLVMGLCLLVYALAEWKLRRALERKGETIPNQGKKEVQNPTMRWVFQVFEGIDILIYRVGNRVYRMILNMKEIHVRILSFLGSLYPRFYLCLEGR